MAERMADVEELYSDNEAIMDMVEFIRAASSRALVPTESGACRLNSAFSPVAASYPAT